MSTLSDIRDIVRVYIEAPGTSVYTNDAINQLIFSAYEIIVAEFDLAEVYQNVVAQGYSTGIATPLTISPVFRKLISLVNTVSNKGYTFIPLATWPREGIVRPCFLQGVVLHFPEYGAGESISADSHTLYYLPDLVYDADDNFSPYDELPRSRAKPLLTLKTSALILGVEKDNGQYFNQEYEKLKRTILSETLAPQYVRQTR